MADFSPSVAPLPPLHEMEPRKSQPEQPTKVAKQDPEEWKLYVDWSTYNKGSGVGIVIFSPEGLVLKQALRLGFATNNVAEYEALLVRLRSA